MRSRRVLVACVALLLAGAACAPNRPAERPYRSYGEGTFHSKVVKLDAVETVQEVAPGVRYNVWTFGGTTPGPVIRVQQGDTVRFTLTNKSTMGLSHSIDFHAAQTPWDVNYVPVAPGKTLTFEWVARFPGVFMYHCGVPPVMHHIANGMYGAIIVEPDPALRAAREYVLVSSEMYLQANPMAGIFAGDVKKMSAVTPSYVVWNGRANQYLDSPLVARPGELIRIWVMNAGPTLTSAFHVIGALFDHAYPDGNPTNKLNGIQTWNVPPGGGAMFELSIPDAGKYPFVTHSFAYAGLGAVGVILVSPDAPAAPKAYPEIGDPFSGGVKAATGRAPTFAKTPVTSGPLTVTAAGIKFDTTSIHVIDRGKILFENKDAIGHDFTIDELHLKVFVPGGESKMFAVSGPSGSYQFYCSIPGHREAGMQGELMLMPAGAH